VPGRPRKGRLTILEFALANRRIPAILCSSTIFSDPSSS
jgi:hypothetical protein